MAQINLVQNGLQNMLKQGTEKLNKPEVPKFSETLSGLVDSVNNTQRQAGKSIQNFIAGGDVELHEVMAAGAEAQTGFQFLLEIRNKLMEAYQEISRLPV